MRYTLKFNKPYLSITDAKLEGNITPVQFFLETFLVNANERNKSTTSLISISPDTFFKIGLMDSSRNRLK